MTPRISVCVSTWRAGCFDPLLPALATQKDTPEFEVIISDVHHSVRPDVLKHPIVSQFARVIHVPVDDPLYPNGCDASRGFNTCLRHASGELVVWLTDHAAPPPNFLAEHWKLFIESKGRAMGRSPYQAWAIPFDAWHPDVVAPGWTPERERELASKPDTAWSRFIKPVSPVGSGTNAPVMQCPVKGGNLPAGARVPSEWYWHFKSESMPLAALRDVNGFDEDYDGQYNHRDTDLACRLMAAGYYGVVLDPEVPLLDAHPVSPRPRTTGDHDTSVLLTQCRDRIRRGIFRCDHGIAK